MIRLYHRWRFARLMDELLDLREERNTGLAICTIFGSLGDRHNAQMLDRLAVKIKRLEQKLLKLEPLTH